MTTDYSKEVMRRARMRFGCACNNCCASLLIEQQEMALEEIPEKLKPLCEVVATLPDDDLDEVVIFAEFLKSKREKENENAKQ
jgi:hypothetical protein